MKKWLKILFGIIAVPVIAIVLFMSYYLYANLQGKIEARQIGNPKAEKRIIIASQGSDFKNRLLEELLKNLNRENRFFYILDCTQLHKEDLKQWDACIIIHTTQIHGMPQAAESFLEISNDFSKVILVTTSGGGDELVTKYDVDGISTASRMSKIPGIVKEVTEKIEELFISTQ